MVYRWLPYGGLKPQFVPVRSRNRQSESHCPYFLFSKFPMDKDMEFSLQSQIALAR